MSGLYERISDSGFFRALFVILVSEIGDKTFLVAAILAMRHPRLLVYAGALSALAVMSILSAVLGHVVPQLLPRRWTTVAAAVLFLVFGVKMLQEGIAMEAGSGAIQEELEEVQKEIDESALEKDGKRMADMEEGHAVQQPTAGALKGSGMKPSSLIDGFNNLASLFLSPIFIQAFVMTFLAEWGDRSQITTIALGAAHNVWVISLGTIIGHACCTAGAVLGGRWLATKISVKHVTLGGAVLFLIFSLIYSYEALYAVDEPTLEQQRAVLGNLGASAAT